METLLVLGAGRQQLPLLESAKRLGMRVVAIDPCAAAPGRLVADVFYVADLADLQSCRAIALEEVPHGVLTAAADFPVPAVAHLCATIGLPGLSELAAAQSTNKRLMRACLNAAGVPCPRSLPASTYLEMRAALAAIGGPAIIKPTVGSGGRGVTRLPADPRSPQIEAAYQAALRNTRADGLLVEEFVAGPEFSVETLTCNGYTEIVAITDKLTTTDSYCVEIGHSQPAAIDQAGLLLLAATARASVAALGIDSSASHVEIRLTPNGPRVIEVGARLGGGCITSHLVPLAYGVDMLRATIEVAVGRTPELRPGIARGAAIRFLTPRPGHLRRFAGVSDARKMPGVCDLELYLPADNIVAPLRDCSCRVGHVIAQGATAQEAVARVEDAQRLIRFATETLVASSAVA